MRLRSFAEIDESWHGNEVEHSPHGHHSRTPDVLHFPSDLARARRFDRLLEIVIWSIVGLIILLLCTLLFFISQ